MSNTKKPKVRPELKPGNYDQRWLALNELLALLETQVPDGYQIHSDNQKQMRDFLTGVRIGVVEAQTMLLTGEYSSEFRQFLEGSTETRKGMH